MLPKLGFSLQTKYDRPINEVIKLLKDAGFSAVSLTWTQEEDLAATVDCIRAEGMILQTLHAPPKEIPLLWQSDDSLSAGIFGAMLRCIDDCARFQVPMVVIHGWQGVHYTFPKTALYFENFDRIVAHARSKGITVVFENLEGEEYLAALMERYPDAGFCWDSGHDNCYPHRLDFLKDFGHRLVMTHLNDNFGLRDPAGAPATTDDLHYLPFDGGLDWEDCIRRLKTAKKQDILNFEIKIATRLPEDNLYPQLPLEVFIAEAGDRARQIAEKYATVL